ncbi:MAG: response regulator, partial [Lachnospiraceae bacterium]|nr:response regulator [Lachnospiraceae bacterium]
MYRIGICDDEIEFCTEIGEFVQKYAEKEKITVKTEIFTSGEALFETMNHENTFDLLFLDIELGGINGVEVGHRLREKVENEAMQIIYVSSKESYAMQLFQIRPFDFLTKPVNMEK